MDPPGDEEFYVTPEERKLFLEQLATQEVSLELSPVYFLDLLRHFNDRLLLEQARMTHIMAYRKEHQRVPPPDKDLFHDEPWLFDPNYVCPWPELIPALVRPRAVDDTSPPPRKVRTLKGVFGVGPAAKILAMMFELDDHNIKAFWESTVKATKLCMLMERKIYAYQRVEEQRTLYYHVPKFRSKAKLEALYCQLLKRSQEIELIHREYWTYRNQQCFYCDRVQYHRTRYCLPSMGSESPSIESVSSKGDVGW